VVHSGHWKEKRVSASPAVPTSGTATATGSQRIGDVDRESVAGLVADATGDGLLQFDEMDERLSRVCQDRQ